MGDYIQNMVMVFVPEDQQTLVPAILASVASEDKPFDFERLMPNAQGGGISGLVAEAIASGLGNDTKLNIDADRLDSAKNKTERLWGCTSNAIFYDQHDEEDKVWTEELDDHYGYEDQPVSIKLNWRFDTKNGTPDELADKFVQRAAALGLGARWYYSTPQESKWNPVTNNHEDQWELLAESTPDEISETQRLRNSVAKDNLFNLLEELA